MAEGGHRAKVIPIPLSRSEMEAHMSRFERDYRRKRLVARLLRPRPNLIRMPNEILLCITDCMEMSDIACLSLCNWELYRTLNSYTQEAVRTKDATNETRRDFLERVAMDYPGLFYCFCCCRLQRVARLDTPRTACREDAEPCSREFIFRDRPRWSGFEYNFQFHHVQLVMMRHRLGAPYGLPLEELNLTTIDGLLTTPRLKDNHSLNVEARMVNDELCLRLQDILVVHKQSLRHDDWDIGMIDICAHVMLPKYLEYDTVMACKLQRLEHGIRSSCSCGCDALRQCGTCGTEFTVELRGMGDGLMAMVMNKWVNMGKGQTPLDPKWQRHLPSRSYTEFTGRLQNLNGTVTTRTAFEGQGGLHFMGLTETSLHLLRQRVIQEINPLRDEWPMTGRRVRGIATHPQSSHATCSYASGCGPTCPILLLGPDDVEHYGKPRRSGLRGFRTSTRPRRSPSEASYFANLFSKMRV